ncbi:MAG: hypothetical protein HYU28_00960 [Actinobacteria bacterium]|nr:hypothetical protein [Actinomycetota bacterium]
MRALSAVLAAAVVAVGGLIGAPAAHAAAEGRETAEPAFVQLANQHRAENGVGALSVADDLVEYARRHSQEMADQSDLHHSTQLRTLTNWNLLGENVGRGGSVIALDTAFMNSTAHRDNVLRPEFSEVGVGVVTVGDTIWVTFVFRQPMVVAAPAPVPTAISDDGVVGITSTSTGRGYWVAHRDGSVARHGDAADLGSAAGRAAAEIVAMTGTPSNQGYWLLDRDGNVYAFGDARYQGSIPGLRAEGRSVGQSGAVSIIATASGKGYWILDLSGGIFTFGDARFQGSVPGLRAAGNNIGPAEVIGMAPTASGGGYWIVDSAGGVFTFGDAGFQGSIPALRAAGVPIGRAEVIGMAPTASGAGYWVLDAAGGVFTFGNASFLGSLPALAQQGRAPAGVQGVAVAPTPAGNGYFVLGNTGDVFGFGAALS